MFQSQPACYLCCKVISNVEHQVLVLVMGKADSSEFSPSLHLASYSISVDNLNLSISQSPITFYAKTDLLS